MKILLLGANGQLGQTLLQENQLATRGALVAASRDGKLSTGEMGEQADLSEPESLIHLLDRVRPDVIVNAAAYTAVDLAEQQEELAHRVNGETPGVLGRWATRSGALVLHYSTDYVFDGANTAPYAVDAPTAPIGAYGRSKLAGERALSQSGANHFIFRTAWVYAPHGKNFLLTMLRLGAEREEIRVVADQYGTPTTTGLIATASAAALDRWLAASVAERASMVGVHHLVASGSTTWHGFANEIIERAHARGLLPRKPRVTAITTAEFPTPARRPHFSLLDNREFQDTFRIALPSWQDGLEDVLKTLTPSGS